MKTSFYIVILTILLIGCQKQVNIKTVDVEKEEALIKNVLDQYVASIENEDMQLYSKIMSHDSSMVNFGAFGNPVVGWENVKKVIEGQNESLTDTKIEQSNVNIHVSPSGKFAWVTSLWNFKANMGEQKLELPVRCSWVLEKKKDNWIIVHWHKSVAVG